MKISKKDVDRAIRWRNDWNFYIQDTTRGVRLSYKQRQILSAIQHNEKTSVCSCNSFGKDFVFAWAAICHLSLNSKNVKVILTAPTQRQVISIMMAQIRENMSHFIIPMDGDVQTTGIKFYDKEGKERGDKFLLAFKAGDKALNAWNGFHSLHTMVLITEATGIAKEIYTAAEGCLIGSEDPRLGLAFNPFKRGGESYRSTYAKEYKHFTLSAFMSPNVRGKKIFIPGQVDYKSTKKKILSENWCSIISEDEYKKDLFDFKFEGKYYRPNDDFRVRVLGEYALESSDSLIPLEWLVASHKRWRKMKEPEGKKRVALDVAGMGRDSNVMAWGTKEYISFKKLNLPKTEEIYMQSAGIVKAEMKEGDAGIIDVVGVGAGTESRLKEQELNVYGFIGNSNKMIKGIKDHWGKYEFFDMNSYTAWALREALDPRIGINLALQPDSDLDEEILILRYKMRSNAVVKVIPNKDEVKIELGRSPDTFDAVKMIFMPIHEKSKTEAIKKEAYGFY